MNLNQLLRLDENLLVKLKSQNMLRVARTKFTGSLVDFSVKQTSTNTRTNDYRMFKNLNLDTTKTNG